MISRPSTQQTFRFLSAAVALAAAPAAPAQPGSPGAGDPPRGGPGSQAPRQGEAR